MADLKRLHLAREMSELNKQIGDFKTISLKPCKQILAAAEKMYPEAKKSEINGDEEVAYIYFMRFVEIIALIKKTKEFKADKAYWDAMLPKEKFRTAIERAEALSASLKLRYKELHEKQAPAVGPLQPAPVKKELVISANTVVSESGLVSPKDFYKIFLYQTKDYMVIDTRPADDFKANRMNKISNLINVPPSALKPGSVPQFIEKNLDAESAKVFSQRHKRNYILLLDWSSTELPSIGPLKFCYDALTRWDPESANSYKSPQLLEGGFNAWLLPYPQYATNPRASQRTEDKENTLVPNLDFEYPDVDEMMRKLSLKAPGQSVVSISPAPSSIDRSRKPRQPAYTLGPTPVSASSTIVTDVSETSNTVSESEPPVKPVETPDPLQQEIAELRARLKVEQDKREYETAANKKSFSDKEQKYKAEIDRLNVIMAERRAEAAVPHPAVSRVSIASIPDRSTKPQAVPTEPRRRSEKKQPPAHKRASSVGRNDVRPDMPHRELKPVVHNPRQPAELPPFNPQNYQPVYGSVKLGLTGLRNLGNTCYMNSIVQCLSNLAAVSMYFVKGEFRADVRVSRDTEAHSKCDVAIELGYLLRALWGGEFRVLSPFGLKHSVGKRAPAFNNSNQQDSQEFLSFLLDALNDDLNQAPGRKMSINELAMDKMADEAKADETWRLHKLQYSSVIVDWFHGMLRSTVACLVCHKQVTKFDVFMYLTLPVPNKSSCSLEDCIQMYFKAEIVEGYRCQRCGVPRKVSKKIDLYRVPPILIIHLNRFYSSGAWREKTNSMVMYPISLNVNGTDEYNLQSISCHIGTMEGGHYTAICRNPGLNRWYKYDDSTVSSVSDSSAVTKDAYMLFYSKHNVQSIMSRPAKL